MLIDTHCHLHDSELFTPEQRDIFLTEARENDVRKIICIGTDPEDSRNARDFAARHEGVYWTYGIHPEHASGAGLTADDDALVIAAEASLSTVRSRDLVAIGEIGLDYHYAGYDRLAQIALFERMLQLARDLDLPVSLHIREAFADALAVLNNFPELRGVVHSFTGNKKELKQVLNRGFYIGVNGIATYSTPPLPPLDRILLETDAPFLTPVSFRGTINKPGYVKEIAAYLATKLGVAELKIAEQTTNNARQIFRI